jgi:glycerate 2-kinase
VISETVLVLAGPFDDRLSATRVAAAIGRGLEANTHRAHGGRLECDLCPLDEDPGIRAGKASKLLDGLDFDTRIRAGKTSKLLDGLDFDTRMRAARALVIAWERLDDRTLAGSVAFEAATRARQAGVPCYAMTGSNELDQFEARILDLQVILQASTPRALSAAGNKLAGLV